MPIGAWAIDPGGPVDTTIDPQPVDEVDRPAAFTLMAPGWYPAIEAITQSYGFCFTASGQVVRQGGGQESGRDRAQGPR